MTMTVYAGMETVKNPTGRSARSRTNSTCPQNAYFLLTTALWTGHGCGIDVDITIEEDEAQWKSTHDGPGQAHMENLG